MKKTNYLWLFLFLLIPIGGWAQSESLKIKTNNPDFKIKVKRCEAMDKTCTIDVLLSNVGDSDVTIALCGGFTGNSKAYDDEGNMYTDEKVLVSVGGGRLDCGNTPYTQLSPNVPVKARIQIEGVPEYAQTINLINLVVFCSEWNFSWDKPVKISNIPISREGDE
ncbi:hypothetical protein [Phocaeicola sp.]